MTKDILKNNETEFLRRFGVSLQSHWDTLGETEKNDLLEKISENEVYEETSFTFEKQDLLRIIIGYDGNNCLIKSLANALPVARAIIWIPDRESFEAYCVLNDVSNFIRDERLVIILGRDLAYLEKILENNIFDNNVFHRKIVALGRYAVSSNDDVDKLKSIIEVIIMGTQFSGTTRKAFNKLPCLNFLHAIRSLNDNYVISQLFEAIPTREIPIIIVSAGPSLMKNYIELKRAKNKAIVIAVAHSMKTLDKDGVCPDIIAVNDPLATGFVNGYNNTDSYMLSFIYADRQSRRGFNGRLIYYGFRTATNIFTTKRTDCEKYSELYTGSVATDIFSLFIGAGFERIILVGQDLAYGENGSTHSSNEFEKVDTEQNELYIETRGIYGNNVITRKDWEMFRKFYERKISENNKLDVIDATEGGALIHGTKVLTLSEAIDKYCVTEYPVSRWIKSIHNGGKEEKDNIDDWFNEELINLNRMYDYLNEAVELNEKICTLWMNPELWNNEFKASCKKYDVLYDQIINGSRGKLLNFYCVDDIQKYIENAFTVEDEENIIPRMKMEYEFFSLLKEKAHNLYEYMSALTNETE